MSERVPVSEISQERLALWLAGCERDHATPLVLVAIGHDERSGELHVYGTEGGPSDEELGGLLAEIAMRMLHPAEGVPPGPGRPSLRGV